MASGRFVVAVELMPARAVTRPSGIVDRRAPG